MWSRRQGGLTWGGKGRGVRRSEKRGASFFGDEQNERSALGEGEEPWGGVERAREEKKGGNDNYLKKDN